MVTDYAREMETGAPGTEATTLVLGGTGKTGRRVVERLAAPGLPVRVGSRSGEPPFDWEDRTTWAPALRGVGSVYVSYYPDLAVPGAVASVRMFAELAVEAGVRRLVLLSGRGEEEAQRAELAVQEAGAEWTILRSSFFSQNFSENFLLEPILGGEVALPAGAVPEPAEEFASALAQGGVRPETTDVVTYVFTEVLDGRNVHLTDGVRRALGR